MERLFFASFQTWSRFVDFSFHRHQGLLLSSQKSLCLIKMVQEWGVKVPSDDQIALLGSRNQSLFWLSLLHIILQCGCGWRAQKAYQLQITLWNFYQPREPTIWSLTSVRRRKGPSDHSLPRSRKASLPSGQEDSYLFQEFLCNYCSLENLEFIKGAFNIKKVDDPGKLSPVI